MSTGGLVIRFFGGMIAGVAAVAIAVGCATSAKSHATAGAVLGAGQERGAWATRGEVRWLTELGVWEKQLMRAIEAASTASTDAKAAHVIGPIKSCSADLQKDVGTPPTRRLEHPYALIQQACSHLETAADASNAHDAEAQGRRGGQLLLQADQLMPPGELRSLPVIAGDSTSSRIDPKFGKIASDLAGKDVEVRCWSRVDWVRLMREEKAYTLHHIDDGTLGFAGVSGSRANLSPEVCDALGELAYHHWMPQTASAKFLLASAVVTLAHEPQHSKGVAIEAQAECYALQLMRDTAMRLGATAQYAQELQSTYWAHYPQELPAYRSSECRNGGKYDLDPNSNTFP
jgi:hypothetical protein